MGKLKKVGAVKVEEKKEEKKPEASMSLMDMLKQQINLRYKNLRKHEEEENEDDKSGSEESSDSF